MIPLRVYGLPVPQPRVRAVRRGSHAGVYTPSNADEWKARIAYIAQVAGWAPVLGAVAVRLRFYLPRPRGHYRTGKHSACLRPDAPHWPSTGKGDVDNLAKAVLDALHGIAWADDCQVVRLDVSKAWDVTAGRPDERPGVEIRMEVLDALVDLAESAGMGCAPFHTGGIVPPDCGPALLHKDTVISPATVARLRRSP